MRSHHNISLLSENYRDMYLRANDGPQHIDKNMIKFDL